MSGYAPDPPDFQSDASTKLASPPCKKKLRIFRSGVFICLELYYLAILYISGYLFNIVPFSITHLNSGEACWHKLISDLSEVTFHFYLLKIYNCETVSKRRVNFFSRKSGRCMGDIHITSSYDNPFRRKIIISNPNFSNCHQLH